MISRLVVIFVLAIAVPMDVFATYSLPLDRKITFAPGIPGGIPDRPASGNTTIYVNSYGAVADDATSDSSAISSALSAATAGDVVEFGEGTYTLTSTFTIPEGVTLRGQGMEVTVLKYTGTGGTIISAGSSGSCPWNDKWCVQVPLSASGSKGDTTLTLDTNDADYTDFNAGDVIVVSMSNSGLDWLDAGDCTWNALANDIDSGTCNYMQTVAVVSRSGGTLTIDTPLYVDMPTSQNAFVGKDATDGVYQEYVGIEDLTLTRTQTPGGQFSMIQYTHLRYSWIKGVEVDTGHGRMMHFVRCYQSTMQENCIHHGFVYTSGALNYHFVLGPGTARCLVTNNYSFYTNKSMQIESTGGGNVISYNYFDGAWVDEANPYWQGQDIGSHCAHAHHELIEGNWFNKFSNDAIHGSASHFILFRNYIDSDHEWIAAPYHSYDDTQSVAAIQSDLGYYLSVVGNILGKEGRSNIYECNPSSSCNTGEGNNHIYIFRTSDNIAPSPYSTILRHANYDYYNDSVIYIGNDDRDLPDSMYLTSKPSWWDAQGAGRPWPPIDPEDPNGVIDIPAKDRFEGETYSGNGGAGTVTTPTGFRVINSPF